MRFSPLPVEAHSLGQVLARPEELPYVETFRIASYNAYNLFGEAEDVYSSRPSPPKPEEQLDAMGEMIAKIEADAIAFQEVQNEKALRDLFREHVNKQIADASQRFSTFVLIPARDPRGINVALATRLAFRGAVTFHDREFGPLDDRPVRFSRDLLGVELYATPKYRFLFFVAHLKSKMGGDDAAVKRRLEATEVRHILEESQFGGKPYLEQDLVLCGDMNDDPDSRTIEILTSGAQPLSDILAPLGVHSYPTHRRYKKTRLDYILTSPSIKVESPQVHTDDPAPEASDHYPVSATVRVQ